MTTRHATVASPLGPLALTETDGRLVALGWGRAEEEAESPLLAAATAQLHAYFYCSLRGFELPLAPAGSEFQRAVWRELSAIPHGRTLTYGALAQRLGSAPRAVGSACGRNPIPIIIPCHRVLAAGNRLGGYSGGTGLEAKRFLLTLEGALLA